jgi:hypothetical protein
MPLGRAGFGVLGRRLRRGGRGCVRVPVTAILTRFIGTAVGPAPGIAGGVLGGDAGAVWGVGQAQGAQMPRLDSSPII